MGIYIYCVREEKYRYKKYIILLYVKKKSIINRFKNIFADSLRKIYLQSPYCIWEGKRCICLRQTSEDIRVNWEQIGVKHSAQIILDQTKNMSHTAQLLDRVRENYGIQAQTIFISSRFFNTYHDVLHNSNNSLFTWF